jgi:hypothetical protein
MNTNKPTATAPGTSSKGLRVFATIISYLFHPVLMPTMMMLVLYWLSPVSFAGSRFGALMLPVILNTLFFPIVVTLLIKAVGFIDSIHMYDSKDRIIPLIASMIFYFWVNNVFSNLPGVPLIAHILTLGAFWGIIAIFMINIFVKISMHTVAAGGALGILMVLMINSRVNLIAPFFAALVVAGLVGTARMVLGAHRNGEIWLGYIVGLLVQLGAYWYLA